MYDKLNELRVRVARLERQAGDLKPFGLGKQDDPCSILQRAKNNNKDIDELRYVKDVLEGLPIVQHDSGRSGLADIPNRDRDDWYGMTYPRRLKKRILSDEVTWGKGKRKKTLKVNIPHITYSRHAQFRMDLRGVTMDQVEDVVMHWHKKNRAYGEAERLKEVALQNKEKHDSIQEQLNYFYRTLSRADFQKQKDDMRRYNRLMEINHDFNNIFVGFVPQSDGSIDIKTVFHLKKSDKPFSSYNCL
tara:strand:- start:5272 stop:6009 length:738 start_codon:yes stop_codon:yes gene_type:complete